MQAGWNFDNSYARLSEDFFSKQKPEPVESPKIVVFNENLAKNLGLSAETLRENGTSVFAGNEIPDDAEPLAMAYAGHQFGQFTMLGDGRAVLLGEQITPQDERFDIQLKGAGRTPYSRAGDGRAALGPMLREYIISEAMHALGIPTSRGLAVVTTGGKIIRERMLEGAILTRVASSHLRVGTFQYAAAFGSVDELRELADYTIERHFPEIVETRNPYLALLQEVMDRQAKLLADWQLVGFIHGVMNTDNMALSGETIDYGPCAFMNEYDPATVFSSIDEQGRYAYGNQPGISGWNLTRFAETLMPLFDEDENKAIKLAEDTLNGYGDLFMAYWLSGMRQKLGLFGEEDEDDTLIKQLLGLMKDHEADYTNTFRALTFGLNDTDLFKSREFTEWHDAWQARLARQDASEDSVRELMKKNNPAVIPRNHRVEEALEAAVEEGDYSVMEKLMDVLSRPYAHTADQKEYTKLPPDSHGPYRTFCGT